MISRQELNPHNYPLTSEQEVNQDKLYIAMNNIRTAYGIPMYITSGVRSVEDQEQINPGAPKSKHIEGAACDVSDSNGLLWNWCLQNIKLLASNNLYLEDKRWTSTDDDGGWVHFQCLPPISGKRIFVPSSNPPISKKWWDGIIP